MKLLNLKTKLILATTTAFVLLLFAGCSKEDATPTSNNAPFSFISTYVRPLIWEYGIYTSDDELVGTTSWQMYSPLENTYFVDKNDDGSMYVWRVTIHTDYWVVGLYTLDRFHYPVFLYKDCHIGNIWDNEYDNRVVSRAKIVSVSERVTVPAGTFNDCIKIEVQYIGNSGQKNYYWIHKNYGNIMAEENGKIYKLHSKSF